MRIAKKIIQAIALAAAISLTSGAYAKLTADELSRLGKDLTPVGAEKAGNADGSIPAWSGGLTTAPAGFDARKGFLDPFAAEKPILTITGANADQYKDKLTAGHYEMLKKYPTFSVHVFPTHRTAAYPQAIYDLIKKNANAAELTDEEMTCTGCGIVPFPIPKSGRQVMWNHEYRWRSGGWERDVVEVPVLADGTMLHLSKGHVQFIQPINFTDAANVPAGVVNSFIFYQTAPAQVEGRTGAVKMFANPLVRPMDFSFYNAGQRRVRKMPETPNDYFDDAIEGLRTADQWEGFFGSLVSYDFKLVGKKEMFVPYNAYKLSDKSLKYKQIMTKNHLNPEYVRYEKHRVWVVEGTLRANQRHVFSKRTWYVDEDSWTVVHNDAYDSRGQLWRVQDVYTLQAYDVVTPYLQSWAIFDLNSGAYLADYFDNEEPKPALFGVKAKWSDHSSDALKRMGTK